MASRDCPLCWKVEASLENISYIILAILSTISGVLSVASNLLVLAAIYSHSPLRKVSSFFIASLAVADFLIGLLVNSVYTSIFISKATEVDFNHPLRVTEHWLWLQSVVTSTFTLAAVSIERYIAVTKCFRYPEIVTVNRCTRCVAAIWVFSRGGIEARPGTEKPCSHNLQSGPVKTWTAVFVIINISDRHGST